MKGKKASYLIHTRDYPDFPEFLDYEIPLELMDARVILLLQAARSRLCRPVYPSPVRGGWARLNGSVTSRHYAVGRLSDAGDIFPERGSLMHCWLIFQQMEQVGGLGLYADTRGIDGGRWPMLHFDLRPVRQRVFWIKSGGNYHTMGQSAQFWPMLREIIKIDEGYRNV